MIQAGRARWIRVWRTDIIRTNGIPPGGIRHRGRVMEDRPRCQTAALMVVLPHLDPTRGVLPLDIRRALLRLGTMQEAQVLCQAQGPVLGLLFGTTPIVPSPWLVCHGNRCISRRLGRINPRRVVSGMRRSTTLPPHVLRRKAGSFPNATMIGPCR